jgi:hypothetical protein
MRIYYDTEFVDNGRTIDLISIGMVAEDGREYYAVHRSWSTIETASHHPWLRENVLPHLPVKGPDWIARHPLDPWDESHPDFVHVKTDQRLASEVEEFILVTPDPQLWAYYGAYDHVALAQLWGPMVKLPHGVPMFTCDLKQEAVRLGSPKLPDQAGNEHNALADARWNREVGRFLGEIEATLR